MTTERIIRAIAGTVILGSIALSHFVHPNWIWLTVFAGANLLQSAFTGFCLPEIVLKKYGIGQKGGPSCRV
ncbi:MAG: DUF2892 domain-containing protein [Verrucomicrobiaceae bacterium]|nr:DUF2892 domain-containing protein [Verrucomicrobiaceae bacterium]